ncbi:hypothetical protein [Sphingobacterium hungaricum]|uniref:Uncharacterized protein n=1 Tax=Sphingobacterium hungaricum TaxID=2082723 RepID=A0A928YNZ1_9SPHI|nr:hypothetical protein [Sphingobacterium hungaricum]MBE8712379.1 hypothetical protein [Sphingobacterium hungaricum]
MNHQKLLAYVAPKIEVLYLEMEEGIATGSSAKITIEGTDANYPDLEDWKESSSTGTQQTYF